MHPHRHMADSPRQLVALRSCLAPAARCDVCYVTPLLYTPTSTVLLVVVHLLIKRPPMFASLSLQDAAPDVVYVYSAPHDLDVSISTCGSSFDTKLIVTANLSDPGGYLCNDDDRGCLANTACSKLDVALKVWCSRGSPSPTHPPLMRWMEGANIHTHTHTHSLTPLNRLPMTPHHLMPLCSPGAAPGWHELLHCRRRLCRRRRGIRAQHGVSALPRRSTQHTDSTDCENGARCRW